MRVTVSFEKQLTDNDVGKTGSHQAGITVPKRNLDLLKFFPHLDGENFNPDFKIVCIDPDGQKWVMRYIYYNGKTFKPRKSTRNEYRLTHVRGFLSKWSAQPGDSVVFTLGEEAGHYKIRIKRGPIDQVKEQPEVSSNIVKLRGWTRVY